MQRIHAHRMIREARDLASEDGENIEYDRALCELTSRCILSDDDDERAEVYNLILSPMSSVRP